MDVKTQWLRLAALAATSAVLAAGGTACFSPRFDSCAVFCGEDGECPQDQFCLADRHCHASQDDEQCTPGGSDGGTLTDGSVGGDDGGGDGGDGGRDDAGRDAGRDAGEFDASPPVSPVTPGDIVINEIQKNPGGVADEVGEWFEVFNPTDSTFDLNELLVSDESQPPEQFVVPPDVIIPPRGFVVFARNPDFAINGGVEEDVFYNVVNPPFQLANDTDDEILIINPNAGGVVLDRVAYSDLDFPDLAGASLSLDPGSANATDNNLGDNWCDGVPEYGNAGDFGTPGAANPPCVP